MALQKCKECGQEVSSTAKKCPHCGAKMKNRIGCGAIILGIIVLGVIGNILPKNSSSPSKIDSPSSSSSTTSTSTSPDIKSYAMGETFKVGYTSYAVFNAQWRKRLSDNQFLDQAPDANWLFVRLTVRNDDNKPRSIAPFKLVDEAGAEYETSAKSWSVQGSIGILESLNPSVEKNGYIVFDVPKNHTYKLKVSGGYWSSENALVELEIKNNKKNNIR